MKDREDLRELFAGSASDFDDLVELVEQFTAWMEEAGGECVVTVFESDSEPGLRTMYLYESDEDLEVGVSLCQIGCRLIGVYTDPVSAVVVLDAGRPQ